MKIYCWCVACPKPTINYAGLIVKVFELGDSRPKMTVKLFEDSNVSKERWKDFEYDNKLVSQDHIEGWGGADGQRTCSWSKQKWTLTMGARLHIFTWQNTGLRWDWTEETTQMRVRVVILLSVRAIVLAVRTARSDEFRNVSTALMQSLVTTEGDSMWIR